MPLSLVAHTIAGSVGGADVTTSAIDTSLATLIVAIACGLPTSGNATGISSSPASGFVALTQVTDVSGLGMRAFYFPDPTVSGTQTFTLASASWNFPALVVLAFSGAQLSLPHDQQNGAATPSPGTSLQPGSITPAENGEVIVTAVSTASGATLFSVDVGAITDQFDLSGGNHFSLGAAYDVQGTATPVNPTWSWTGSQAAVSVIASFKAATGTKLILIPGR